MAGPAIGAGAGIGLGLIGAHQKKAEYNRQKQLAADMEKNSAWTGVHGKMPGEDPNAFGSIVNGALQGAQMGSSIGGMGGAPSAGSALPVGGDPSAVQGYNISGQPGGIAGGSNPFGLQQPNLYSSPSWGR